MSIRKTIKHKFQNWKSKYHGKFGPLPQPKKWVFIVGCYNSGTTLLHDMLASHPEAGSMRREGQYYTDQLLIPSRVGYKRLWSMKPELFYLDENSQDNINIEKLKRQWGANYNHPHRAVLLEKSPPNTARVRWLQKHFENAYFIGIIRNGYAVAEGIHRKADHSIEVATQQWVNSNRVMLEDFPKLQHKKIVRYEDLTENPQQQISEILEFLGLSSEDVEVEGKSWKIHKVVSRIENMNPKSLKVLTPEDKAVIEKIAGEMLRELGYME